MKSTFYNEEQSVKSAPKKLTDMLSFNSCDLLTLRGIILCKIKNALQLCLRIPPHVRWPFALFVWIFLYYRCLFETAKFEASQLPKKH